MPTASTRVPGDAVSIAPGRWTRPWFERRLRPNARTPALFADTASFWRMVAQAATIVMAVLMLGAFLYFAHAFVVPVLCAFVVGMTLGPVLAFAARRGIPAWLTAVVIVVLGLVGLYLALITLAQPVSELIARAPELGTAIKDKLHILDRPFAALHELQVALGVGQTGQQVEVGQSRMVETIVTGLITVLTPAAIQVLMQIVLFFGTLVFFIVGRTGFRKHAVNWFATRDERLRALRILNDIEENLSGYLLVVTAINLALGVVTTILAYLLGLPAPLLWGVFAFGLNYIPYVGPGIVCVLLFGIGLLTFATLWGALLPPAAFLFVTLIEGQILTPLIIGRAVLSLHPLAVFLGIAFWAWLWGPVGAFVATPILIVARVALDHLYPRHEAELPG
jgi:predicted PurR-regulated permease PerM